ncbi:MAG: O-antigen ligase family protein [Nitrospirae bacterium]|nr:MAG: O-antigen ligase family protein [Nitrospirota bacterium]
MSALRGITVVEGGIFSVILAATLWLLAGQYYIYAAAPILVAIFLFLLSRYPVLGYALIVFMVPFDSIRGASEEMKFLSISKFVGIWLLLVIFTRFVVVRSGKIDVKSNLWPNLGAFFVISLISALMSDFKMTAMDNIRQLITAFSFYFITLAIVTPNALSSWLPRVLIASITLNSLLSVIGFVFKIPFLYMDVKTMARATGFTNDPNFFSSMVLFGLPLIAAWWLHAPTKKERFLMPVLFLVNIFAVVLSYSRAAFLVFFVMMVFLIVQYSKKLNARVVGFAVMTFILAGLIFIAVLPDKYLEHQKTVVRTEDPSIGRRASYLYVAWDILQKDPLLGVGPGAFRDVFAESEYALQFAQGRQDEKVLRRFAHNSYVEIVAGTGVLGLAIFLAIVFKSSSNFGAAARRLNKLNLENLASIVTAYRISQATIMIYFFFVSNVYHKYLWIPLALSEIALRLARAQETAAGLNVPEEKNRTGGG